MIARESCLPIAVRVYPGRDTTDEPTRGGTKPWMRPDAMFVFDTETRVDATQRLTFGSYRFMVNGDCLEEGLFYADDLPEHDRNIVEKYAATHSADTARRREKLRLWTRAEFVERLYKAAYKSRVLLIGFNLPFDLSRIAFDATNARGRFAGGFSLGLWSYQKDGHEYRDQYRPRIGIKHIDSKRALKGFTARNSPDQTDLIPEGSETGQAEQSHTFRGHFLDLRTLAFVLTDRSYSLKSACEAFGVEHGKQEVARHGEITPEYIDYNRRDVLATCELAVKLLEEYDRHALSLQVTKAYSPASLGKAYLREMGIIPVLKRQPAFPAKFLGYAQSAFYGGRTSAHIRKFAVPVVATDFLSMYPTVNSLMGLWAFVIAREIELVENCTEEIRSFLNGVTAADLFRPVTWRHLTAFVRVVPEGDILPMRAKFSDSSHDWQVAVNPLFARHTRTEHDALWYSLPDVVTSVILTGRVPEIVDAFRMQPRGIQPGLKPVKLRGVIEVDPREEDFFRVAIEQRRRVKTNSELNADERDRLERALKVLANATSYGIYAEMNRQESDEPVRMVCNGIDPEPFECRVSHPEIPGEYCFPPLAALITGAARLMLALLEHTVTELGGTYAMEDTDSMAIVATEPGGLVPCPDGPLRIGKKPAIKALSWEQVRSIELRFVALNPYDPDAVPGSILKIEDDNFDPGTGGQRQVYCFAISAKRYALFTRDAHGLPVMLERGVNNHKDRWSEHGLGHLLNPIDPDSADRKWIRQVWLNMIRSADGLARNEVVFAKLPAVGRVSISSPFVMRPFATLNHGKPYSDQVKPFNFVLTCHVNYLGHPSGADPEHFHLIAPYESNSAKWLKLRWIDRYSGVHFGITTSGGHGTNHAARVKKYGDVLEEYEFHPEPKCADSDGGTCDRQTVGLLHRRPVQINVIKYIGKESNAIEDVDSGLIQSADTVYTEYPDPRRDEWRTEILPALKRMSLAILANRSGLSRRMLINIRAGRSRPHPRNREKLSRLIRDLDTKTEEV